MDTNNSISFASNAMMLVTNISNGRTNKKMINERNKKLIDVYKVGKLQTKRNTNNDQM